MGIPVLVTQSRNTARSGLGTDRSPERPLLVPTYKYSKHIGREALGAGDLTFVLCFFF